jgi:hypothetical protein
MKLPLNVIQETFPEDEIKTAFLRREDISKLSPEEQEKKWEEGLPNIRKFLGFLSEQDTLAVIGGNGQIRI